MELSNRSSSSVSSRLWSTGDGAKVRSLMLEGVGDDKWKTSLHSRNSSESCSVEGADKVGLAVTMQEKDKELTIPSVVEVPAVDHHRRPHTLHRPLLLVSRTEVTRDWSPNSPEVCWKDALYDLGERLALLSARDACWNVCDSPDVLRLILAARLSKEKSAPCHGSERRLLLVQRDQWPR